MDKQGFDSAMERQRATARKSWVGSGDAATEALWFELRERLGATEFLGYESDVAEARVDAIVVDGEEVETADAGRSVLFITNQTPFYGESGGQVGDTGIAFSAEGCEVRIDDTRKHLGDLQKKLVPMKQVLNPNPIVVRFSCLKIPLPGVRYLSWKGMRKKSPGKNCAMTLWPRWKLSRWMIYEVDNIFLT